MNKTELIALLEAGDKASIAKALETLKAQGSGNKHLLAQMFGVGALTDIEVGSTMDFADMYMKYNDLRPKAKDEKADNFKSLPQQMWRDQGIKFELAYDENKKAIFRFLGYDEAKHEAFRAKNKAQKDKEKAKKEEAKAKEQAEAHEVLTGKKVAA